jgi:hypothetical protein
MTMFLVLIAIQACLIIYTDQTPENTLIWQFVTGLNTWGTLGFILALLGIAGGIGLVGIAAASTFGFKTDFLIFAPAIAGLISMGLVFTNLAKALQDDLIGRIFTTCDIANPILCTPVTFIIAITIGPVALYYVWTIIEWWRGKDY